MWVLGKPLQWPIHLALIGPREQHPGLPTAPEMPLLVWWVVSLVVRRLSAGRDNTSHRASAIPLSGATEACHEGITAAGHTVLSGRPSGNLCERETAAATGEYVIRATLEMWKLLSFQSVPRCMR